jgi:Holliday junction resolvase-like predicted endonuclease
MVLPSWPPRPEHPSPYQIFVTDAPSCSVTRRSKDSARLLALWAEDLVEALYQNSGWKVLNRRFRTTGTEIDLVVCNPLQTEGRIVEVKARSPVVGVLAANQSLASVESLISRRKIESLRHGANIIAGNYQQMSGNELTWSCDLVLVVPGAESHLIVSWSDVFQQQRRPRSRGSRPL